MAVEGYKKELASYLEDYVVKGVGVVDKESFVIVGDWFPIDKKKKPTPPATTPTKVISVNIKTGKVGYWRYHDGIGKCFSDGGYINAQKQALTVDMSGHATYFGYSTGVNGNESYLDGMGGVSCVKLIGDHFYITSANRKVSKRVAPGDWEMISQRPYEQAKELQFNASTYGIAGFAEDDLYICGDKGDLWHFDGDHWRMMDPPCNWSMEWIECAADGNVYVCGSQGEVLVGRDGHWEQVIKSGDKGPDGYRYKIYDVTWFKGHLYMADGFNVRVLKEGQWHKTDFGISTGLERLDANEDVMIIGAIYEVRLFDGEGVTVIYENADYLTAGVVTSALVNVSLDILEEGNKLLDLMVESEKKKP